MNFFVGALLWSLLLVLLIAALAHRGNRGSENQEVTDWAGAHGVSLTTRSQAMVRYYLRLGAVLRTIGGLAGIALAALAHRALGVGVANGLLWWVWVMGGYLLGALWAELFLTRPIGTERAAALSPRQLSDYLPARLRWSLRAAGAASVVVGLAGFLDVAARDDTQWTPVSTGAALGLGLGGGVIALVVEALQRLIVRRPQPVVAVDLLQADDAMRASSVHTLAGTGLGMVLLIIGTTCTRLLAGHHLPFGLGAAPLALWIAALIAWRYYSYRAWRVRRPVPRQPVAR